MDEKTVNTVKKARDRLLATAKTLHMAVWFEDDTGGPPVSSSNQTAICSVFAVANSLSLAFLTVLTVFSSMQFSCVRGVYSHAITIHNTIEN